jgi:hypothetical protein
MSSFLIITLHFGTPVNGLSFSACLAPSFFPIISLSPSLLFNIDPSHHLSLPLLQCIVGGSRQLRTGQTQRQVVMIFPLPTPPTAIHIFIVIIVTIGPVTVTVAVAGVVVAVALTGVVAVTHFVNG